MIQFKPTIVH